ncbi:hypothetical protein CRM22_001989 [Opisthorchis felineus]|uniref:Uncharacterized protein n=1 Tax=Opisthorchis felineus TaxID=147828 RepID=A0A4S2M8H5_OPIFE|nr:hypothetical protein CRM22_001989 [Opisthorchis felineus]
MTALFSVVSSVVRWPHICKTFGPPSRSSFVPSPTAMTYPSVFLFTFCFIDCQHRPIYPCPCEGTSATVAFHFRMRCLCACENDTWQLWFMLAAAAAVDLLFTVFSFLANHFHTPILFRYLSSMRLVYHDRTVIPVSAGWGPSNLLSGRPT